MTTRLLASWEKARWFWSDISFLFKVVQIFLKKKYSFSWVINISWQNSIFRKSPLSPINNIPSHEDFWVSSLYSRASFSLVYLVAEGATAPWDKLGYKKNEGGYIKAAAFQYNHTNWVGGDPLKILSQYSLFYRMTIWIKIATKL